MAVVAPFIRPSSGVSYIGWTSQIAFGQDHLPREITEDPDRCSGFVHLEVANADPTLFAAFAGKVSTTPPSSYLRPPPQDDTPSAAPSDTLTLYLEPAQVKTNVLWQNMCATLAGRLSATTLPLQEAADIVSYLVYRNVDAREARRHLCPRLKVARRTGHDCGPESPEWAAFVAGKGVIGVKAADPIGAAGPVLSSATQDGRMKVAIGLRTRFGMDDPGTWYLDAQAAVEPSDAPTVTALVTEVLQIRLPLIEPNRPVDEIGRSRLWPWSALSRYRRDRSLTYADWRTIGQAQKALYRARLVRRFRPTQSNLDTARFEFDADDALNLFQLEAIAEFHINFPEPWNMSTVPGHPGDPNYSRQNFLSLFGASAAVSGTEVTLDGQPDMSRISAGRDTIELEAETTRKGRQFRIMGVDQSGTRVTVDRAPDIAASAWRIHHNPTMVVIDAFGSRVRGTSAIPVGTRQVRLQELSDTELAHLERVNPYETVSFAEVSGQRQDSRITRITVDREARTASLSLDVDVSPAAAGSAWAIPAGLGGVQGIVSPPKRAASPLWGWDHYDGMLFLIGDGEIVATLPWSTYTSRSTIFRRKEVGTAYHSSVKGNKRYQIASVFSGNPYINIAWRVSDPDGLITGNIASRTVVDRRVAVQPDVVLAGSLVGKYQTMHFLSATPPRFSAVGIESVDTANNQLRVLRKQEAAVPESAPYWLYVHDGVRDARYYFKAGVDPDVAPPGTVPPSPDGELGKGAIRIHLGETTSSSGSHGCLVSPYHAALRSATTWLHLRANQTYYLEHPNADRVLQMDSLEQPPPPIKAYQALVRRFDALQQTFNSRIADPMTRALNDVHRSGTNETEVLTALQLAIDELRRRSERARDSGDDPTERELEPIIAELLDLAASEDATTIIELADEIGQLRLELSALKTQIDSEKASWGWDDAIHGEIFVIRPDERSA